MDALIRHSERFAESWPKRFDRGYTAAPGRPETWETPVRPGACFFWAASGIHCLGLNFRSLRGNTPESLRKMKGETEKICWTFTLAFAKLLTVGEIFWIYSDFFPCLPRGGGVLSTVVPEGSITSSSGYRS